MVSKADRKLADKNLRRRTRKERCLSAFGMLYYPVQYLIIRLAMFGFVELPTIMQLYNVFNISGILSVAWEFRTLFPDGFSAIQMFFMTFKAIPLVLKMVFACRNALIFAYGFISLVMFVMRVFKSIADKDRITANEQVVLYDGPPGSGKTRMSMYASNVIRMIMWDKLRYIYWRDKSRIKKWEKENNVTALSDFKKIKESYEYYTTPQYVEYNGKMQWIYPAECLFSNIMIYANGKHSSKLTYLHAIKKEWMPMYTVSFWTEIAATFGLFYSSDKNYTMADGCRYTRQFDETIIIGDEQDANNFFKDGRRVVSNVLCMESCRHVNVPLLLNFPYRMLRAFFTATQLGSKIFAPVLRFMELLVGSVGFVKFKYYQDYIDIRKSVSAKRYTALFRLTPQLIYDTRAFRMLNPARELSPSGEIHTSFAVENTEGNRQAFLSAYYKDRPEAKEITMADKVKDEFAFWEIDKKKAKNNENRSDYPEVYARYEEEGNYYMQALDELTSQDRTKFKN